MDANAGDAKDAGGAATAAGDGAAAGTVVTRNPVFPFTAVTGQDELSLALTLCAVDPGIGGVLALGDRGTGKTTLVRSLAGLLARAGVDAPVVDVPLGVTEDRLIGSLDVDVALAEGRTAFRPGLLADAHGGFLYIDEVNLLDDHLVDVLLDVAASGVNIVERDGVSHSHPARFTLVGSGNPEEGDLRPQLEDRFGLSVDVRTIADPATRVAIVRARLAFDEDPEGFVAAHEDGEEELAARIAAARVALPSVELPDAVLVDVIDACVTAGCTGHRSEIVLSRAARAHAALRGAREVGRDDVAAVLRPSLRHRVPREAFDTPELVDARLVVPWD
ncbi:ATP-binding protein [Corynebacterium sp. 335C]